MKNDELTVSEARVYAVLNVGIYNAIHQQEIKDITGYDKRTIRFITQSLRKKGYPVCSTPYDGYWIAEDAKDLEYTINVLKSQVRTLQETIEGLNKSYDKIGGVASE